MATKTRTELVFKALSGLGALAAGQVPDDEDVQAVTANVTPTIEELSSEQVVSITDEDEIPVEIFLPVAAILAENSATDFGRPKNEDAVMKAKAAIRLVVYGRPTREVLAVDYF